MSGRVFCFTLICLLMAAPRLSAESNVFDRFDSEVSSSRSAQSLYKEPGDYVLIDKRRLVVIAFTVNAKGEVITKGIGAISVKVDLSNPFYPTADFFAGPLAK